MKRIVLLLTFSLALALWARRRTKLEVPEVDGVQPVDPWLWNTINGTTYNGPPLTVYNGTTTRWSWTEGTTE